MAAIIMKLIWIEAVQIEPKQQLNLRKKKSIKIDMNGRMNETWFTSNHHNLIQQSISIYELYISMYSNVSFNNAWFFVFVQSYIARINISIVIYNESKCKQNVIVLHQVCSFPSFKVNILLSLTTKPLFV